MAFPYRLGFFTGSFAHSELGAHQGKLCGPRLALSTLLIYGKLLRTTFP